MFCKMYRQNAQNKDALIENTCAIIYNHPIAEKQDPLLHKFYYDAAAIWIGKG